MKKYINIILTITLINISLIGFAQNCVQCSGASATGETASAIGINTTSSGKASFAGGMDSEAIGRYSFAFGDSAKAWSRNAIALGKQVSVFGAYSFGVGENVKTTTTSSMIIGSGFDDYHPLENGENKSLMIGFNSSKPTFFVKGATGDGYTGKIGIGDVTDPQAKLHIKADNSENADLLLEPTGSGKYARIEFGSLNNRIDATMTGDLNFRTASDFVFWDANVGIGTYNPATKLDVAGTFNADGAATFGNNAEISGNLTVNGISSFNNTVTINNKVTATQLQVTQGSAQGKILQSDADGNAGWVDPMALNVDDGDWEFETGTNNIYKINGKVGIGTASPDYDLHIASNVGNINHTFLRISNENYTAGGSISLGKIVGNGPAIIQQAGNVNFTNSGPSMSFIQKSKNGKEGLNITTYTTLQGGVNYVDVQAPESDMYVRALDELIFCTDEAKSVRMKVEKDGEVVVTGDITVNNLLTANSIEAGMIEVKEISKWQDDVFKPEYNLRTLSETERFIKQNGHLPEIPSEADVLENGYNVSEMDARLLQKIEELTLYVIELKKEINELKNKE